MLQTFFLLLLCLVPLVPALMLSFTNFKDKSKQSHNISHNKSYAVHAHVADILTQALITRLVKSTSRSLSRDYLKRMEILIRDYPHINERTNLIITETGHHSLEEVDSPDMNPFQVLTYHL